MQAPGGGWHRAAVRPSLQTQLDGARPSAAIQRKQLMYDSTAKAYKNITGNDPSDVLLINRGGNQTQTQGGQQPQGQPQLTNFQTNPQTGQRIGWNGTTWIDAKTNQPVGGR